MSEPYQGFIFLHDVLYEGNKLINLKYEMNGNLSAKEFLGVFHVFVMAWKLWGEFLHHQKSLEIGID